MTTPAYPMIFFGCIGAPGHFMWSPGTTLGRLEVEGCPFEAGELDGVLLPRPGQLEHVVALRWFRGWTVAGMWDRSVDRRPGSCAAFAAPGTLDLDRVVLLASVHFPEQLARLRPPGVEWRLAERAQGACDYDRCGGSGRRHGRGPEECHACGGTGDAFLVAG